VRHWTERRLSAVDKVRQRRPLTGVDENDAVGGVDGVDVAVVLAAESRVTGAHECDALGESHSSEVRGGDKYTLRRAVTDKKI